MSSKQKVEPRAMNDAAAIRSVIPRHTVKRLADLLGVPLGTAHEWVHRHFSAARRREVAAALLIELGRQEQHLAAGRQHLLGMVGDHEVASSAAGDTTVEPVRQADKTIHKVG